MMRALRDPTADLDGDGRADGAHAKWINDAGLRRADAEWEERRAAHRAKHDYHTKADQLRRMLRRLKEDPDQTSVWEQLLSSQTDRRIAPVSRSKGVVLGEHAALFGRCSASVWATSVVETLCIEAKAFYEFVVLVRRRVPRSEPHTTPPA